MADASTPDLDPLSMADVVGLEEQVLSVENAAYGLLDRRAFARDETQKLLTQAAATLGDAADLLARAKRHADRAGVQ